MDRDNFALNKQTNKIANIKWIQILDETVPYMCELQNTTSFPFFFLIFFNCYSKKEKFLLFSNLIEKTIKIHWSFIIYLLFFFVFFLFFFKWIFLFRRMFPSWAAERTCWISVRWSPLWCWNAASWRCGREAKRRLVSTGTRSRPRCRATTGRRTPVTTSESDTFPYRSVF